VNVLGQDIVFANSRKMTYELFDKRAPKYSDRVTSMMAHELYVSSPILLPNFI